MFDIAPGSKQQTLLEAQGPEGVAIRVPVGIVRGAQDGPTLAAVAGVHGTEYCGIEAIIRLHRQLDPANLAGTVVTAIANLPAFLGRSMYVCPVDNKNLGRFFPGDRQGSYSEVLAYHLFEKVVRPADYVVDLHGGDLVEDLVVYTSYHAVEDEEQNRRAEAMALAYGAPFLQVKRLPADQPFTTGGLYDAAARAGKVAVLTEAGGQGILSEACTRTQLDGLLNILRHCDLLDEDERATAAPVYLGKFIGVPAPAEGIFYPAVEAGAHVRRGQHLGELRDFFGNKFQDIESPADAAILGVITAPPMKQGDMLFGLGELV